MKHVCSFCLIKSHISMVTSLWDCIFVSCEVPYDIAEELPLLRNCSSLDCDNDDFRQSQRGIGHDLWSLIHSHHIKVLHFQVGTIFETTFLSILKCLQELLQNPWHSIFAAQTLSLTANILRTKLYQNIVLKITKFANVE